MVSPIYHRLPRKNDINYRRIAKELKRRKLALASFVPFPRLIKGFHNNPKLEVGR